MDRSGQPVAFDGSTASASIKLNEGTNTIPLRRVIWRPVRQQLVRLNADATFTVQYE
ncbi:hypothetical protein [Salmonella enterica]|uniref:hypothetical protein n=1 Tax=Salmonella enterica TaxID=28901 RepID=UPI003F818BFB